MLQRLGLALVLGLLVGLQRERTSARRIAGFRTFALVTLLGGLCAALVAPVGGWIVGAGFLGVAALVVAADRAAPPDAESTPGITTEIAMLLMFVVGAALMLGPPAIGVCLGATTAILLHLKPQLHAFAARLEGRDVRAIMQFALVSAVILPVAPDVAYDAYGALNPRRIWLMVTLITGIGLVGYLLHKFVGSRRGAMLAGALGGAISSTATTASFSRAASGRGGAEASLAAVVVGVACTIMYVRVLIEIGAVAPSLLGHALAPIGAMGLATGLGSLLVWRAVRREPPAESGPQGNPAELRAALLFGCSYAVVGLAAAYASARFGARALYPVSLLSGATEMDAITLSISRMVTDGALPGASAWRFVVVAAMANTAFKWAIAGFLGGPRLALRMLPAFGASLGAGGVALAVG